MKNYIIISVLFLLSCNRNEPTNQPSIDAASLNEIISNYSKETQGEFTFGCSHQSTVNSEENYISGFGGIVFDKLVSEGNRQSIKIGKITLGNLQLFPISHVNTNDNKTYYQITTTPTDNNYITSLFNKSIQTINVFDSNMTSLLSFNFYTPLKLHSNSIYSTINMNNYNTAKLEWNADLANNIGIVADITRIDNNYNLTKDVKFLSDKGVEPIRSFVDSGFKGTIEIKLYRGTILIKKGNDNKDYKVICIADSKVNLLFE